MHDLFISEEDLEKRRKEIHQRLKALSSDVSYVKATYQPIGSNIKAVAIYKGQRPASSYKEWRVSLMGLNISIGYFEIWQYVSRQKDRTPKDSVGFLLQKAYLHVYLPNLSGNDKELLFVHCDPQEPQDSPHHRYKIAPHLHFGIAGIPWKDAHIPLCDGWQKEVLRSLNDLDGAIIRAVDFIAHQIVPLLKANG